MSHRKNGHRLRIFDLKQRNVTSVEKKDEQFAQERAVFTPFCLAAGKREYRQKFNAFGDGDFGTPRGGRVLRYQ